MPGRALPNLGLKGFFTSGEAGWGADVDLNFLTLSVLTQGNAISKVSTTPLSPTNGQVYIFDQTHPTQSNKVAVRDNGAWVYLTPSQGWSLFNIATQRYEDFTTVWSPRPLTNFVQKISLNGLSTYTYTIPSGYSSFKVLLHGASTAAVIAANPFITVNGLGTAIYSTQRQYSTGATNTADELLNDTSLGARFGGIPGTTTAANSSGFVEMECFDYTNTTFKKIGKFRARQPNSATTAASFALHGSFDINLTAAITSITVTNNSGNYANGSTLTLTMIP